MQICSVKQTVTTDITYQKLRTGGEYMQKMIMIPEERYYKMLETYDKAMKELEKIKNALKEAGTSKRAN